MDQLTDEPTGVEAIEFLTPWTHQPMVVGQDIRSLSDTVTQWLQASVGFESSGSSNRNPTSPGAAPLTLSQGPKNSQGSMCFFNGLV